MLPSISGCFLIHFVLCLSLCTLRVFFIFVSSSSSISSSMFHPCGNRVFSFEKQKPFLSFSFAFIFHFIWFADTWETRTGKRLKIAALSTTFKCFASICIQFYIQSLQFLLLLFNEWFLRFQWKLCALKKDFRFVCLRLSFFFAVSLCRAQVERRNKRRIWHWEKELEWDKETEKEQHKIHKEMHERKCKRNKHFPQKWSCLCIVNFILNRFTKQEKQKIEKIFSISWCIACDYSFDNFLFCFSLSILHFTDDAKSCFYSVLRDIHNST